LPCTSGATTMPWSFLLTVDGPPCGISMACVE
jgi:hypothetical protein